MQRVTIKDIARLAGVSVTTVSRALNNAPEINEETKARILHICQEQGYRSNLLARSLVSNRTHVIAVILPDIARAFYSSLALHIEIFAKAAGYEVMLCSDRFRGQQTETLFDFLASQRVDGVLLASANPSTFDLFCRYRTLIPGVLLNEHALEVSQLRISSVSCDDYMGGHMAAEYLHGLGHRQVVYLDYHTDKAVHALRQHGFQTAADRLGMRVKLVKYPVPSAAITGAYQATRQLLLQPFEETAVFAATDTVAMGVMQAADELGISIPGQLSLLGFGNIDYSALPKIRLTTFDSSLTRLAQAGVQLLLEQIEHPELSEFTYKLITPRLVERSTCRQIVEQPQAPDAPASALLDA